MPTISIYLEPSVKLSDKDLAALVKSKGSFWEINLTHDEYEAGKFTSKFKLREHFYKFLKTLNLSTAGFTTWKTSGKISGAVKDATMYDISLVAHEKQTKLKLDINKPDPLLLVDYGNDKIKRGCSDKKFQTKIQSIASLGPTYTGHGKVEYLKDAFHAHVTNTEGVAWFWKGKKMEVVAYGKKNDANSKQQRGSTGKSLNTCQYDWTDSL